MRFLLLLALAGPSFAQFNSSGPPGAVVVGASPSGQTCTTATAQAKIYNGTIYTCQSGTYAAVSAGGGGTGNVSASGTPTATQSAQWTDATHVKGVSQGVFNVRTMYGAVPDGSTDNATAIASAFTASNAMTTGIPTVYFDCDTSSTTCKYNYGGSGTSPINPTTATTIQCATGVTLNYAGTAHAADIGATGLSLPYQERYTIKGCRWTGGASMTAGIYVNTYNTSPYITENTFSDFGNRTGYTIVLNGNVWTPVVSSNYWRDTGTASNNILDAHSAGAADLLFTGNKMECGISTPCSVSTMGVGLWINTGWIVANEIKYHQPLIRIAPGGSNGVQIDRNMFEGNTGQLGPAISFGNPGTTGAHISASTITNNTFYWPTASAVPHVGPESASSGTFTLDALAFTGNYLASPAPSGGAVYVNTGGGPSTYIANNTKTGGTALNNSSSPTLLDAGASIRTALNSVQSFAGCCTALANTMPVFDSSGVNLWSASYHSMAGPLLCLDSTGSGTAQTCNTTPRYSPDAGVAITPSAGDTIIYKTTTTNTGALTLNTNGTSAVGVRKNSGASTLSAGDLKLGIYYPLTFDGTFWEMPSYATVVPTSCTGLPSGALFNSSGTASFCP